MGTGIHLWGRGAALTVLLGAGISACITLTPITAIHQVDLRPLPRGGEQRIEVVDNSAVFVKEGLQIKVRYLDAAELDAQYPGAENPFTFRGEVDPRLGYVPNRFTVFHVSVSNPTFDKVLLQPERVSLVTDRGHVMHPYYLTRAEARGDTRNFETYWLSRGVQSGNMQKLYLERMGTLRGAAYHRNSFVFKGSSYAGKIVFDPLARETHEVTLHMDRFVLEFGIYDSPKAQIDLDFPFSVQSRIVDLKQDAEVASARGSMVPKRKERRYLPQRTQCAIRDSQDAATLIQ